MGPGQGDDQGDGMNSEQLRYFELAYRERNFSAAARLVPCSPQGLAKSIHALEKELGVPLFSTNGETGLPEPTDYAHELFEFAAVFDSNLRLLRESFDRIAGSERSRISLACSLGVMGTLGPEFLTGFAQCHPEIEVAYWEGNDIQCEESLAKGERDLGIVVGPPARDMTALTLYRCPIYFWVNAADPLASKELLRIEDLSGRDVAIPGEGFKCLGRLRDVAAEASVQLGRIFEMSEIFQLYEFAASGRGLGFTVRHLAELPTFSRLDSVVAVPIADADWSFALERVATHALTGAEQAFWNWCAAYAKRLPSDPL